MSAIPDEAIEKAAEALYLRMNPDLSGYEWHAEFYRLNAHTALVAALPALMEWAAQEMTTDGPNHPYNADEQTRINAWCGGLHYGAALVRALGGENP